MKKKLGEFLIEQGLITPENLNKVLALQQALKKAGQSEEKTYLGQILLKKGFLTSQQLQDILHQQALSEIAIESNIETPSQASEKETAQNDLLGALELFSSKKNSTNPETSTLMKDIEGLSSKASSKVETRKKETTSTLLPHLAQQPKTEEQQSRTQKMWKEFEIEEEKRYAVMKTLGEGGMGVVELVKDQLLGREVARKTIKMQQKNKTKLSRKEEVLFWRFKKEASITALLEHPHIIPLYEMQRPEAGEIQFTMRKVEGQTLRGLLQKMRKGEIAHDETQILSIFRKVCDAMAYAHSKGVIHRDLKPDNVMIGEYGEVYVMDWGIAKRLEESAEEEKDLESLITQQKGEQEDFYKTIGGMGTPGYMSPEQQENASNVTAQSDIYSLGKILRECFTLLSPMEEIKQRAKKTLKAEKHKREVKNSTESSVPEEIEAIEKKAIQENLEDRYPSVQEMVADLERYQKHFKISAKEYGLLETLMKWAKRNRQKLVIMGLFLGLCGGFYGYSMWKTKYERENQCKDLLKKAEEVKAQKIENIPEKEQLKIKIQNYLEAFNFLEDALTLKPGDVKLEKQKQALGETLIDDTCRSEDYTLAEHIAKSLKRLSILNELEKQSFFEKIHQEKDALLNQHLDRLKDIEANFKPPYSGRYAGDVEDSIYEISKMQEPEVLQELLKFLQIGTQYILNSEKIEDPKLEEFYLMIIESIGRLGNPEAGRGLIDALKAIMNKIHTYPLETFIPHGETTYMLKLALALKNARAIQMGSEFDKIRYKMQRRKSPFYDQTVIVAQKLAEGMIDTYSDLIKSNANNAIIYDSRGAAKLEKKDYDGAIADFTEAIRLNSQYAEAHNNRGTAKKTKGDLAGALADYSEAIHLNPQFFEAYYNRGNTKFSIKDYEGAIKDYSEAIYLNPQYSEAYSNRGNTKLEKEDYEGAIEDYTEAIRLNPQFSKYYVNRGNIKAFKKDFEGAIEDYTKAIRLDPQFFYAYNNRGRAKSEKKDFEGAIADYMEAIRLNPQYSEAYYNRGEIKFNQMDLKSAIADYTEAIRLNPQFSYAYNNRGEIKFTQGDLDGALLDYIEAIRLNPQFSKPHYNRGNIRGRQQDFKGAIADFTEAIRLNPQYSEAYYNRGNAKFSIQDYEGAIKDYTEALHLNPQLVEIYCNRGIIYLRKGNKEKAKADFQQFLNLTNNISDPQLQSKRQQLLQQFPDLKK